MSFKFNPEVKNNLYHDIRVRIKEKNINEATQSILFLFEHFINENLSTDAKEAEAEESTVIKEDTFKPGGSFRRV